MPMTFASWRFASCQAVIDPTEPRPMTTMVGLCCAILLFLIYARAGAYQRLSEVPMPRSTALR